MYAVINVQYAMITAYYQMYRYSTYSRWANTVVKGKR